MNKFQRKKKQIMSQYICYLKILLTFIKRVQLGQLVRKRIFRQENLIHNFIIDSEMKIEN